ncbi:MAG: basic amino acid/polyamine antiporter [Beijerinckiaceae bacterium]|nr:basic amino acid/polyamine antiporter [Beijerinckiaceae bacterium]
MSVVEISTAGPVPRRAEEARTLGRGLLTALVIGSMIGAGVFSLPQNMAAKAGPLAILIGWAITGIGMLALALVYQSLSRRMPRLNSGPYAYARAGFGDFVGFNSAWGYWLSAWLGNVSYAVVLFGALSYFWPAFGDGNTWQAILGASAVLWAIHFLILGGIRTAAITNLVTTIAKIAPIVLFLALILLAFRIDVFTADFSGLAKPELGGILTQVKSTMLVTLWVFIGVEGASVVSGRATHRRDIGFATLVGFLVCLALYAGVSLLSLGILSQGELAGMKNPSMAGVMAAVVGPWGAIVINLALVVSVLGAFLSWTLLAAEIPFAVARDGLMPKVFAQENASGSPAGSLWITNGLVQLVLIVAYFANSTYQVLFSIASVAILVPYVLSGAYALKLAVGRQGYGPQEESGRDIAIGGLATLYGAWLVYAADTKYLFLCAMLYAAGVIVFTWARIERVSLTRRVRVFTFIEFVLAVALVLTGLAAAWFSFNGTLSLA